MLSRLLMLLELLLCWLGLHYPDISDGADKSVCMRCGEDAL